MGHRVVLVIMLSGVLGGCAHRSAVTGSATTQAGRVSPSLSPRTTASTSIADATVTTNHVVTTESSFPIDWIPAQIDLASTDVCTLISPQQVQTSFGQTVPLTTQPMAEAKGPACGYPYPQGGYLLVIQFQNLAKWGEYAGTGRPVEGLAFDALYSPASDPQALVIRDVELGVVIRLLAPQSIMSDVDSLLMVAADIYGTTSGGVRVAPLVSGS